MDISGDNITPTKRYYLKNREKILAREKEKRRWVTYYAEHKEEVNARHREAYQRRKAAKAALAPGSEAAGQNLPTLVEGPPVPADPPAQPATPV